MTGGGWELQLAWQHRWARAIRGVNVAEKVVLATLLTGIVIRPDLPAFANTDMHWRAATYPLVIVAVPVGWYVARWLGVRPTSRVSAEAAVGRTPI